MTTWSVEFRAMGTTWWVRTDEPRLLDEARSYVADVESRLSRFRPDSALTLLNRRREARDAALAAVTKFALELRALTAGAFDPTLGLELRRLGYDRSWPTSEALPARVSPCPGEIEGEKKRPVTLARVEGDRVFLEGDGELDLGGVAKGWTVDRVIELFVARGCGEVLVDGGGDIRGAGRTWSIGVGDGRAFEIASEGVATSSTRVRRWRAAGGEEMHHILDPHTRLPARSEIETVTVIASNAATADGLATAAIVAPAVVLPLLPTLDARAIAGGANGAWWVTPNWEVEHG